MLAMSLGLLSVWIFAAHFYELYLDTNRLAWMKGRDEFAGAHVASMHVRG